MASHTFFMPITLANRLGQPVNVTVSYLQFQGRDYFLVSAPHQQASSIVAKNAEPFAFQLREHFGTDARRFELIEVRETPSATDFYRWRFEWVGNSPLSARSEPVVSPVLRAAMVNALQPAAAAIA